MKNYTEKREGERGAAAAALPWLIAHLHLHQARSSSNTPTPSKPSFALSP
eukprot:c48064_g1_i1 orf=39-188(-)